MLFEGSEEKKWKVHHHSPLSLLTPGDSLPQLPVEVVVNFKQYLRILSQPMEIQEPQLEL